MFGAPRQKHTHSLALYNSDTTILGIQKHCRLNILCIGLCLRHPPQKHTFLALCLSNTPIINRHPKTLLLPLLVQKNARQARHTKTHIFLASCMSNPPILGVQSHSRWHFWCKSMRVQRITPKTNMFWHCAFQTRPY